MKVALSYVKDPRVKRIVELSIWLRNNLQYPNSENSNDERRYVEYFEEQVKTMLKREKK